METEKEWSSRWDGYWEDIGDINIHWFSISISITLIVVLTCIVARILKRVLQRDIDMYNSVDIENNPEMDIGWKRLKADVFRPPNHSLALTSLIGTGFQVIQSKYQ